MKRGKEKLHENKHGKIKRRVRESGMLFAEKTGIANCGRKIKEYEEKPRRCEKLKLLKNEIKRWRKERQIKQNKVKSMKGKTIYKENIVMKMADGNGKEVGNE